MKDGDQDLDLDIEKDDTYNDYGDSKYHPFVYPLTNLTYTISSIREYRVIMANNLIGCWESPAANQIIHHSNPLFGQLNNTKQIKQQ